jgi:predicted nucleic acid-binding protein
VREAPTKSAGRFPRIVEEELFLARFNDVVVLPVAIRRGASLASFDAKLRKQATKLDVRFHRV